MSMPAEDLDGLLSDLAATAVRLQHLVGNLSDEQLRQQQPNGEFSVVENVCHLRDIEVEGYTTRIKRILSEEQPLLADIDGSRLAIERDYQNQVALAAVNAFTAAREQNLIVISRLAVEDLGRTGTLAGAGSVTMRELLVMMRDHDAAHLKDIELIIARLEKTF